MIVGAPRFARQSTATPRARGSHRHDSGRALRRERTAGRCGLPNTRTRRLSPPLVRETSAGASSGARRTPARQRLKANTRVLRRMQARAHQEEFARISADQKSARLFVAGRLRNFPVNPGGEIPPSWISLNFDREGGGGLKPNRVAFVQMGEPGFSTGLCDCCTDAGVCLNVSCCGWTLAPSACAWAGSRREPCGLCHWAMLPCGAWTRDNIRRINGVSTSVGRLWSDYFVYAFCGPCATCQDLRELDAIRAREQPAAIQQPQQQAVVVIACPQVYPQPMQAQYPCCMQPAVYQQQPAVYQQQPGVYQQPPQ
jgi:hypothetical protein